MVHEKPHRNLQVSKDLHFCDTSVSVVLQINVVFKWAQETQNLVTMSEFITKELEVVKAKYSTIEGSELISCVPAMVQIKIV